MGSPPPQRDLVRGLVACRPPGRDQASRSLTCVGPFDRALCLCSGYKCGMRVPLTPNWEHQDQPEPEVGPEALGTSSPTAPDFAGEQMELREFKAFVQAACWQQTGIQVRFPKCVFPSFLTCPLPTPALSFRPVADMRGWGGGCTFGRGSWCPEMCTALQPRPWTSRESLVPKVPDARAWTPLAGPRSGLPSLLGSVGQATLPATTNHQTPPKPGRPPLIASLNFAT